MSTKLTTPSGIIQSENYEPNITLIIATYNESKIIQKKLDNLKKINYPKEKLDITIVDSSEDNTVEIVENYLNKIKFPFKINVLKENQRQGKSKALNHALKKSSNNIIALSDADSFWEKDSLKNAIKYMHDPNVGAVTGKEKFLNLDKNVITQAEGVYRDSFYYPIRLGESNLHSTIMFQGEFSIWKKDIIGAFNEKKGADDTGTVINVIQKGYRTIFVPEAIFWDIAPSSFINRLNLKMRRAVHVMNALSKAVKLKNKNEFPQPSIILYFNYFIHLINPLLSIPLLINGIYLVYRMPILLSLLALLLMKKFRVLTISYVTSNIALLMALVGFLRGNELNIWNKIDDMRDYDFEDQKINELLF